MEAAVYEFKANGFADTAVADIMDTAGLGVGTFYNYFGSKEEVLMAIVKERFKQVELKVKALANNNSPTLKLLEFCSMSTARLIDENRFILPMFGSAIERADKPEKLPKNISPEFKKIFEDIISRGQSLKEIRGDIPVDIISEMFHSIYQAAALSKLEIPFQENIRLKVKVLLDGIKND